jgi:PAS domain S-box-containing protein
LLLKFEELKKNNQGMNKISQQQKISNLIYLILERLGSDSSTIAELLESLSIPATLVNANGICIAVNEAYCNIYNYSHQEIIGKDFLILCPPEMASKALKRHKKLMSDKKRLDDLYEVQDSHQQIKVVQAVSSCVHDANNQPYRLSIIVDITKMSEAEQQLLESLEMLNTAIGSLQQKLLASEAAEAIMLHDLRKPISNMIWMADLMRQEKLEKEELLFWLQKIEEAGSSSLDLMDRYSCLQQMGTGDFTPDYSYFDLIALIHEVESKYVLQFGKKALILYILHNGKFVGAKDHYILLADRTFIRLMLSNLLLNAIEASPEFEAITLMLQTDAPKGEYNMALSINHKSMVPVARREDYFKKCLASGNSIGAYIAKSVALAHQGVIEMKTSPAEGTTVCVRLPNSYKPAIRITDRDLRKGIFGKEES